MMPVITKASLEPDSSAQQTVAKLAGLEKCPVCGKDKILYNVGVSQKRACRGCQSVAHKPFISFLDDNRLEAKQK